MSESTNKLISALQADLADFDDAIKVSDNGTASVNQQIADRLVTINAIALEKARADKGYSLKLVADAIRNLWPESKMSESTVLQMERRHGKRTKYKHIIALALVYNRRPRDFVLNEDNRFDSFREKLFDVCAKAQQVAQELEELKKQYIGKGFSPDELDVPPSESV